MRSPDSAGVITAAGIIAGSASAAGLLQPGSIPVFSNRTALGVYDIYVPKGYAFVAGVATSLGGVVQGIDNGGAVGSICRVRGFTSTTGAAADGSYNLQLTLRKL